MTRAREVRLDPSIFASIHIAYSLDLIPHPSAQAMVSRTLAYLLAEMTGHGLWHYWNKGANWGGLDLYKVIPADLDDMAGASYLLERHGIPFPDNRPLMLLNRDRKGLFYSWLMLRPRFNLNGLYWRQMLAEITFLRFTYFFLRTPASYEDVDGVVNANVLLYLGDRPETRPVVEWLIRIVEEGREADCDKWYRHPMTFFYALSRNVYNGSQAFDRVKDAIIHRIELARDESGGIGDDPLHTALAVNTVLNFGERPKFLASAIDYLLGSRRDTRSWASSPYYYGGNKVDPIEHNWGSEDLTTALCLEALYRFQQSILRDDATQQRDMSEDVIPLRGGAQ